MAASNKSTASSDESPQKKPEYSTPFVTFNLILNIALSISIVLLNKSVYTHVHFPNMTLTLVHFIFTTFGMVLCRFLRVFTVKPLPLAKMLPISLTFCGFVVITNLSLQMNSVGTYQIIKTLTTPCVMLIQTLYYSKSFSFKVKLTLIPIGLGVFLNSYFDLKFNIIGIVFALAGVIVTSLYQVWVNEKQSEFSCDAMQLLYYQAPLSATCLAVIIPFFEPVFADGGIFGTHWSAESIILVCSTGVVAFAINVSIFWIIGNTSPLTYNMVGHCKFCLTLLGGYVFFHDPVQFSQLCGIAIVFVGILSYTHFKLAEQREDQKRKEQEQLKQQLPEGRKDLKDLLNHSPERDEEDSIEGDAPPEKK